MQTKTKWDRQAGEQLGVILPFINIGDEFKELGFSSEGYERRRRRLLMSNIKKGTFKERSTFCGTRSNMPVRDVRPSVLFTLETRESHATLQYFCPPPPPYHVPWVAPYYFPSHLLHTHGARCASPKVDSL
ncbi:hypothetical protein CEXT_800961 [Caerostris extrusa]|uniref:Uncharacterized protein n=1 Tax=Caerostris extrusa TaxID=172846 RepID=A0AAV4WQQ3_CAEEX|nr:hypothetical protein CEXT_800961 [Caerostris extrusa]